MRRASQIEGTAHCGSGHVQKQVLACAAWSLLSRVLVRLVSSPMSVDLRVYTGEGF